MAEELGDQISAGSDQLGALAAPGARPELCGSAQAGQGHSERQSDKGSTQSLQPGAGEDESSSCLGVLPDSAIQRPGAVWSSWSKRLLWFVWL